LHIFCRCRSCVETTVTDANCKPVWVRLHDTDTLYGTPQPSASTLAECQTACKFDPRCVEVYFWDNKITESLCYLHANTVRNLSLSRSHSTNAAHYALLASRCNKISGQCFDKILFFLTDRQFQAATANKYAKKLPSLKNSVRASVIIDLKLRRYIFLPL